SARTYRRPTRSIGRPKRSTTWRSAESWARSCSYNQSPRRVSMIRGTLLALVGATIPLVAQIGPPSAGTPCTSLAALTIPTVTIKSANLVAAGPFTPPSSADAPATTVSLPAHCRIEATARPTSDSEIKFEVWIPPVDAWNGKLEGVGNGGYSGAIGYSAMATGLRRGYAVVSTDTGHAGDDMKFGQAHPEKLL